MRAALKIVVGLSLCVLASLAGTREAHAGDESVPGEKIEARATFNCIGIKWPLQGDDNQNATCKIRFRRKGTTEWREAMDLFRIKFDTRRYGMNTRRHRKVNAMCGSIFRLAPQTAYEVELKFEDADGGKADKVLNVQTQYLPSDPVGGRVVKVAPGELKAKLGQAQPGDILLLQKGEHAGGFQVTKSGAREKLIVIRGAEDGEAVIKGGVRVTANFVWFDNLVVECGLGTKPNAHDVFVSRCNFRNTATCMKHYGHQLFIFDNRLKGNKGWDNDYLIYGKKKGNMSGEGIDFSHAVGGRCVAAFNDITELGDGYSYGDNNIDVYRNIIYRVTDDLIEPDYAFHNFRCWENRLWAGLASLSWQPFNGGPWYFIRNQVSSGGLNIFKLKEGHGANNLINNTFYQFRPYKRYQILFTGMWANNVWCQKKGSLGRGSGAFPKNKMRMMDNNVYGTTGKVLFSFGKGITLEAMQAMGLDKKSHLMPAEQFLTHVPKDTRYGTGEPMLPKEGSVLIDGAAVIPNVTGPYLGKAPDIGAYEVGLGVPWVGPRNYSADRLAWGAPKPWAEAPLASLKDYSGLGAPASVSGPAVLIARAEPKAFVLISFEPMAAEKGWKRYEELLGPVGKASNGKADKVIEFLDGLGARIVDKNNAASLIGAQVSPNGVWKVVGGCATKDRAALQGELYSIVGSLQQTMAVAPKGK